MYDVCVLLSWSFIAHTGGWYRRQYILLSILPAYLLWLGQILCWWSIDEELPHNALHAHHWSWSYSVSIQYLYTNNTRVWRKEEYLSSSRHRHLIFRGGACFFLYQTHTSCVHHIQIQKRYLTLTKFFTFIIVQMTKIHNENKWGSSVQRSRNRTYVDCEIIHTSSAPALSIPPPRAKDCTPPPSSTLPTPLRNIYVRTIIEKIWI